MERCNRLVDIGRRQFLRGSAFAAAGMATAGQPAGNTGQGRAWPRARRISVQQAGQRRPTSSRTNRSKSAILTTNAPGVLLKLGTRVEGGAGPDGDIVGFSTICPHKGFPLNYNADDHTFNCPGHYSRFDADAGGQQIWGQSTANLPQYALRIDDKGDIYAEGVDELLYGRLSNVL